MLVRLLAALAMAAGALAAWAPAARAEVAVPRLEARVTDVTGTLSAEQKRALEAKLAAFEAKKGTQIAVLIVPTTRPETIEQYSIRVAGQWKLGRKGVDDGVLLLVAKDDRALRIEVGYGLEGVIPDALAWRVINEVIVPPFRAGDFYGGLNAGVDALAKLIQGEPLPAARAAPAVDLGGNALQAVFVAAMVAVAVAYVLGAMIGRVAAAGLAGLAIGLFAWATLGLLLALIAGVVTFLIALPGRGSGFYTIGRGGGWSGGGGFGGGGWSGGGGGFGGGGASGRW
ncbi:MAG: TPM domain-containing protein [Betaproteobacteria bacterium]|nr:TPM domain-containing protein [Betaproteobacteria bacterium]